MSAVRSLGGEDWFQLGDGDLALHVLRSQRRQRGDPLYTYMADFASAWGIAAQVLPLTDAGVEMNVQTDEGRHDFQHYFVVRRGEQVGGSVLFQGVPTPRPDQGFIDALSHPHSEGGVDRLC